MNKIFKKRLGNHLITMAKYLKYVFNDFFVIALMFMVGGLGFAYSNFLKTLQPNLPWERPVAMVILLVVLQLGGLATLLKYADRVFLSPKEYDMKQYLKRAFQYSYLMSSLIDILAWFVLLPFVSIAAHFQIPQFLGLLGVVLLLKYSWMAYQLTKLYWGSNANAVVSAMLEWFFPFLILWASLYWSVWGGLAFAFVLALLMWIKAKSVEGKLFDWMLAIQKEDTRLNRIYHFFSLFTDVPKTNTKIHRRKIADVVLNFIPKDQRHFYANLYARGLVRNSDASSLFWRLIVIALLLIVVIPNSWITALIAVLFMYLIGFQLMPFFTHFDENVFLYIYPISQKTKIKDFSQLVRLVLYFAGFLMLLALFLSKKSVISIGVVIIFWIIEIYLLTVPYLKKKYLSEG